MPYILSQNLYSCTKRNKSSGSDVNSPIRNLYVIILEFLFVYYVKCTFCVFCEKEPWILNLVDNSFYKYDCIQ